MRTHKHINHFTLNILSESDGYRLKTRQELPLNRDQVFEFFKNPLNLSTITPSWLNFECEPQENGNIVYEGAEYNYKIRWLAINLSWKSRITLFNPPHKFIDLQIKGPYKHWEHTHAFYEVNNHTVVEDIVYYVLPFTFIGRIVHSLMVKKQLESIFYYRAIKVEEMMSK